MMRMRCTGFVQGLGEGPAGVLLGTWDDGNVILLQNMKKPRMLCSGWNKLESLAATDQIVVGGHVQDANGELVGARGVLRVARMDAPF